MISNIAILSSPPVVLLCIATSAALPLLLYLYHEYLAFKALGPGGTPQTIPGFLKVFALSFLGVARPYEVPRHYKTSPPEPGRLRALPMRAGERPETRGIAPQRQVTQKGDAASYRALGGALQRLRWPEGWRLSRGPSVFDTHSPALFAEKLHPSVAEIRVVEGCQHCDVGAQEKREEICHVHPSDGGSMHVTLCPGDMEVVIKAGWGERHPLARGGWFERFVPEGFVLVYAPRSEEEVEVVMRIIEAAVERASRGER